MTYTAFDLPQTIQQGALTLATLGYDGDQTRIRKTTPDKETLYFGDLYERVTAKKGVAKTEHKYFVHSPERIIAVVTRGGDKPGTLYLHTDHLGSVDVVTNEVGGVEERRSYDPFGKRRNPIWGQPAPASFSSETTLGFTGHEGDDELGLVNARGRIYDPRLGRFLSTDPILSDLFSGQSFNAYSYVTNNPLKFVDPTGFQAEDGLLSQPGDVVIPTDYIEASYEARIARYLHHEGPLPHEDLPSNSKEKEDARQAGEVGAAAPPTDVDTTGSSPEISAQAATTAPEEGLESSTVVRAGLGFSYGVGQAWLPGGIFIPSGSPQDSTFEFWRGAGQFSAGVVEVAAGVGLVGGGAGAAGGGIAGAIPTGGASLLIAAAGGSAMTAGWAAVVHGATSVAATLAGGDIGAGPPPAATP